MTAEHSIDSLLAELLAVRHENQALREELKQTQIQRTAYLQAAIDYDFLLERERENVKALSETVAELQQAIRGPHRVETRH